MPALAVYPWCHHNGDVCVYHLVSQQLKDCGEWNRHVSVMLCSLTFPTLWFLGLVRFLWVQATFGCSRVYFDSAAGGRGLCSGGQPQICQAGSRVDRAWCCICRSWSHIDRASSHGRPEADGGLGNWLLLSRTGWLRLRLQREGWQKRTEERDQCWQLIHIQWNYCHVWLNHWINDSPNYSTPMTTLCHNETHRTMTTD